jgi:hypothetical protein
MESWVVNAKGRRFYGTRLVDWRHLAVSGLRAGMKRERQEACLQAVLWLPPQL